MTLFEQYLEAVQSKHLGKTSIPEGLEQYIGAINWDDVFGNSSQSDNLADFAKGRISFDEFVKGFYPRSKNQTIIKKLPQDKIESFKQYAKKLCKRKYSAF